MQVEDRTGRFDAAGKRPEAAGERLAGAFEALREECSVPPAAPGFLAGFRARRDTWRELGAQTAAWRILTLRLAPAGGLAAIAAMVLTVGLDSSPTAPETAASDPAVLDYEDPLAAGLEEAGVATMAMSGDEPGYELLAVLYEPLGTR